MSWFKRKVAGITTDARDRNTVPDGYWLNCPQCKAILSRHDWEDNLRVCPDCDHHFPMDSLGYLRLLFGDGDFELYDENLLPGDPLEFRDRKPYGERVDAARKKTGLNDAVRSAIGHVGPFRVSAAAMEFNFIGGSMGSVVGEIVARTIRRACEEHLPLIIVAQSGGARMMEGALSLMQMAKTSAWLARFQETGLPFFSILTHPTTGGVTASFAMLGDFHFAEPKALIGFAGPRVIRETIGQDLPTEFQTAEFVMEKGFVDRVVHRHQMRHEILRMLQLILEPAN